MGRYIPASTRALDVWRSIQGDPTSISFKTLGVTRKDGTATPATTLAEQTVRISMTVNADPIEGVGGIAPKRKVTIFGVRDHPTIPNTIMEEGYTALIDGDNYRIVEVVFEPGEVRAHAEVIG